MKKAIAMKRCFTVALLTIAAMTANAQVYLNPQASLEERVNDALSQMTLHEKILVLHAQSKFTSAGVPRLGIRQLNMDDGPHGVREELEWNTWRAAQWTNDSIVAFPSLTCLAATWNRELSRRYGHSLSEEFAFRGKDILLGPGVNIARTPMNGRAFEYMGEDPVLAGEMAVPYIQAAQQNGVACCLKHYVLNDQETDRFGVNVNVSERALREIYLKPFETAVKKAHVWTIMGSYNFYDNEHCCHNSRLISGILKGEWQWDGAVISDWGGTTNTLQAAYNGLDIEMGTFTDGKVREATFGYNDYFLADKLESLIRQGEIPLSVLDEKVARVLRTIFRTSMNPKKVIGNQCSEAHYETCRQIAEEGIVLLKNTTKRPATNALLPLNLSDYKKILVVGENGTRSLTQGGGSSELKTLRDVSPLDAIRSAVGGTAASTTVDYAPAYSSGRAMYDHVDKVDPALNARLKAEAIEKAKDADLVIFIGGLNKNHRQDCENGDRDSYDLSFGQNEIIADIATAKPQAAPLIVVTFGGNPFATPWLPQVDAFLHCWYLGSESGTALVNILTGKTCPSGRLPVTFAQRYEDYPYVAFGERAYPGIKDVDVAPNSAGEKPRSQVYYDEDIYVGYRGFQHNNITPQFPFGFGLSYTTFELGNEKCEWVNDSIVIAVDVKNTGSVAGKETAQVYVSSPDNKQTTKNPSRKASKKQKPLKELKAFAKTALLKPGESQTLRMTIARDELASWSEDTHQWFTPSGTYTVYVGKNSTDSQAKKMDIAIR